MDEQILETPRRGSEIHRAVKVEVPQAVGVAEWAQERPASDFGMNGYSDSTEQNPPDKRRRAQFEAALS